MKNEEKNLIQIYFKEICNIYKENNNEYDIEYCAENRDKLIKMNLKSVVYIAKKYVGLGVDLEDLIQAGNIGLCIAYDKYDPSRNTLKSKLIEILNEMPEKIPYNEMNPVFELISYGTLFKKFEEDFEKRNFYNRNELISWVNNHIFSAKFNSIAAMWIRAYILLEIDNNSRIVKKPKSEIYKDKQENNTYSTEITTNLSGLETDENFEYEETLDSEIQNHYESFKNNLKVLLTGISVRDRSILLKKFGIGLPRPMLPKEIADQEGLSIARISQILKSTFQKMQENGEKYGVNIKTMYDDLNNMIL